MKEHRHNCIFTIFGATGDLANRKLLPAFYYLEQEKLLGENFTIVCVARKEKTHEEYRQDASASIKKFSRIKINEEVLEKLLARVYYHQLELTAHGDYESLKKFIEKISGEKCGECERVFYLAVPTSYFGMIVLNLKKFRLAERQKSGSYNRVMFEKPFGYDLKSAKKLNNEIIGVFNENQIYRIDHYMAKELVQNMLVLRFANSIFEPLWNRKYIDHIQITVAETLGIEGRGNYYDKSGALRDIVQNHAMQLLALIAMEEPKDFTVEGIRNQKIKVLKSVKNLRTSHMGSNIIKGQYIDGVMDSKQVPAYVDEPEVGKKSITETFAAMKLEIGNEMWKNVPFYIRTGKRLKEKATEIVIVYKDVPFSIFRKSLPEKNMMVIRVQPYEGITLQFNAKVPGKKVIIDSVNMDFCHECKFGPNSPEAYEKLLYDVTIGDQTLFTSWSEVEEAWKIVEPVLEAFKKMKPCKYKPGTWGPEEANKLIEKDNRKWVEPKRPSYAEQLDKMVK